MDRSAGAQGGGEQTEQQQQTKTGKSSPQSLVMREAEWQEPRQYGEMPICGGIA